MDIYEVIIGVTLALLVGGLIGFEREKANRPAGLRTHMLVCVGATVISMIQMETIEYTKSLILANPELAIALKADIGRMGAQVVTGVGFLGAGTIIKNKGLIKGLTTAATVWVVACIGLAIGMGMYFITAVATLGVLVANVAFKIIEKSVIEKQYYIELEVRCPREDFKASKLKRYFAKNSINTRKATYKNYLMDNGDQAVRASYVLEVPKKLDQDIASQIMAANDSIMQVKANPLTSAI